MWKNNRLLRFYGKMGSFGTLTIVILLSFLKYLAFGEPLTTQYPILNEDGTRFYSNSEIDLLINDLAAVAVESIEKAAAEAAKAASIAALEREAALLQARALALREAANHQAEALRWRIEAEANLQQITQIKKSGIKNTFLAGAICLLCGLAFGVGTTLTIGGK